MIKKIITLSLLLFTLPNSAEFFFSTKENLKELLVQAPPTLVSILENLENEHRAHLVLLNFALKINNRDLINYHSRRASEIGLEAHDLITEFEKIKVGQMTH